MEGALAVPIAMGLGYWADTHFGTSPLLLLVGAVVGFGALVRRLMSMRSLVEAGEDENDPPTREDGPQTREEVSENERSQDP